jgi:anti-sigma factor RsiW
MKPTHAEHAHTCRDFLERLSRYLDDDLPLADRRTIEKHLADCPCCEDVLESLKDTVALCHDKGRPSLPKEVRTRARQRVRALLAEMEARHS